MQSQPATARLISDVIQTAATRHSEPVDPLTLLDTRLGKLNDNLRARLNSIVAYHLHHNHKLTFILIGKAYKVAPNTIRMRYYQGLRLHKKSPWRETYTRLP